MLDELNEKQIDLIDVVRNEWLSLIFSNEPKIDRKQIKKSIEWLYKFSGLKKPIVVILDSLYGIQVGANMIKVRNQVGNQVRNQVGNQVVNQVRNLVENLVENQVRNQVGNQVWNQVWNQVRNQVGNQVVNQVVNQVRNQVVNQVRNQVRSQVENLVENLVVNQVRNQVRSQVGTDWITLGSYGDVWDYGWVSFHDYFERIGIVKSDDFIKFKELLRSGIFSTIQLKGICFVSVLPRIKRDNQNRLHSQLEPAMKWEDGYEQYYLDGVYFEKPLWEKITQNKITPQEIFEIPNQEQKSVAIRVYGYENITKDLKMSVLSEQSVLINGQVKKYQVLEVDLKDDERPARFVKVCDWSTDREYLLRVDPRTDETEDCIGALAWTAGVKKEDYKIGIET